MTEVTNSQEMNAQMFDFDNIVKVSGDPFKEEKGTYGRDERFYRLAKDSKTGVGGAIIRFLPDSERAIIKRMYKIGANCWKGDKKRFVSDTFSPQTIGLPDPFQEYWQVLYNLDQENGTKKAKDFSRGITFISNIKIIKDPLTPENEGKIFLLQMSGKLKDKINDAMDPSEQDRALGSKPKQMFNPLVGNNFKLSCSKGENKQINYDSSIVIDDVTSIYGSVEECLKDIKENTYKLSGLIEPDQFLSYDELVKKLDWVLWKDQTTKVNTLAETATVATAETATATVENATVATVATAETPTATAETPTATVETVKVEESQSIDAMLASL